MQFLGQHICTQVYRMENMDNTEIRDAPHHQLLSMTTAYQAHPRESNDSPPIPHKCRRASETHPWLRIISEWYLLLLYLLYTLVFTVGMVYWLNGKSFAVTGNRSAGTSSQSSTRLTQTNVTTIISGCLVVARIISSAWQALAAWRCVFILFEKTGLSLSEASCIATWRFPAFSFLWHRRSPERKSGVPKLIVALCLILVWPAQLANPVASGAVSWIPSTSYEAGAYYTLSLGVASTGYRWDWYKMFPNVRDALVKKSAALAGLTAIASSSDGGGTLDAPPAKRMGFQLNSLPDRTAVDNVIVPIFNIESFKWISDIKTIPDDILQAVTDISSGYLNITQGNGPLSQTIAGTSALLKSAQWSPPTSNSLPAPEVFSGTKYAAIYVARNDNGGQGVDYNCRSGSSVFDPLPADVHLINIPSYNNHSDCLAVAELKVSAGVTRCRHADLSSSPAFTCRVQSGVLLASNNTVSPDPLVSEVFAMMPEVQALLAALSFYESRKFSGKLEMVLRNSLVQGYQGTWSAMTESFADPKQPFQTQIWEPIAFLEAQVSSRRMYIWMGLGLLLVVSGLLLVTIQISCQGETASDPAVTAILLDSSDVINTDNISKDYGDAKMKLSLKVCSANTTSNGAVGCFHPKLVPQG